MSIAALASSFAIILAATYVEAQGIGTWQPEVHPPLIWKRCSDAGARACEEVEGELTLEANWRWAHNNTEGGWQSCIDSFVWWDPKLCPDAETCSRNCGLDGAEYKIAYGVTTSRDVLNLQYATYIDFNTNVGSRLFLMNGPDKYQMFSLLGNEFSFDVNMSEVGCGVNAALNFLAMDEDGGLSRYPGNTAGARYGTGYCDANCSRDQRFINGKANLDDWTPSPSDQVKGYGRSGSCCPQMALWSGNSLTTSFAAHPCLDTTQHECRDDECSGNYPISPSRHEGGCDVDGCGFNPYRQADTEFYGPGKTIDTTKKFSVITQFVTGDDGTLESIRRLYQQDGRTIVNTESKIPGVKGNAIDKKFCAAQKDVFGERNFFDEHGGLGQMSKALSKGMVLSMEIWHDDYSNMLWLDGHYPVDQDPSHPGVARGTCGQDTGSPSETRYTNSRDRVVFSNFRYGPLNSTFEY